MDPKSIFFTRAIVGPPRDVPLGAYAGAAQDPEWDFEVQHDAPPTSRSASVRRIVAFVALAGFVGAYAAGWVWLQAPTKDRPIAFAFATPASAPAAAAMTSASAPTSPADLPISPANDLPGPRPTSIALEANPFLPPVPEQAASQPSANAKASSRALTNARDADKNPPAPLLVLDAAKPEASAKAALPASIAAAASPAASSAKLTQQFVVAAASPVSPQARVDSVTIVDIARDGSYALVTNPATRLPERVVPGQKIYTGEVIVKIDPAMGKIQLDKRTIGLQ